MVFFVVVVVDAVLKIKYHKYKRKTKQVLLISTLLMTIYNIFE
jgi:hypothetical protein